ncbi:RNA 2',3'-cyclic phosphodiesterase [Azomonas macrocytogenes]|uniref:RNA 2',3'-cyclic phosphodiesterase n=1 Tax=Azomonas macrocytogenes TaxID=69962 RepID=A0A839T3Q8_AZOMA|nr:RNA 2',3'-cyclic phosphodiesterase [Azomonas macrocytogenes]MBB3104171.1 2'-5' RNA ligase [Azomonas macrocytogenes]
MPADPLRLFFALPCPPELSAAMCTWRAALDLPGRPVAKANLHMTLAFLGAQPPEALATLKQLGNALSPASFELRLDRLHIASHGLVWIEPSDAPAPLLELAERLRNSLSAAGIAFDDSKPFRAHVTLLREARGSSLPDTPAFAWPVREFGLYASQITEQGVHYRPLASWPLTG